MKTAVVLDKNFIQGASANELLILREGYRLVMPGALFFELLTTDVDARIKCFSKLPTLVNPVILVEHIGVLLKYEGQTNTACGKPSNHRVDINFEFNSRLTEKDYALPPDAQIAIQSQIQDAELDVERLIDLSESAPSLFPEIASRSVNRWSLPHCEAEALIANAQAVKEFYEMLEAPDSTHKYPRITGNLSEWAHVRYLQVLMLFAVDLHIRYEGRLRDLLTPNVRTKLEHDVHDAQILALAVLEGAIATKERKLVRWFKLLAPLGVLHGID